MIIVGVVRYISDINILYKLVLLPLIGQFNDHIILLTSFYHLSVLYVIFVMNINLCIFKLLNTLLIIISTNFEVATYFPFCYSMLFHSSSNFIFFFPA